MLRKRQNASKTLLAIYHRIDSELRSQSENDIRDRTLVDLYWYPIVFLKT